MKLKKLLTNIGGGTLLCLGMMSNAYADIDTLVQYSTTGAGDGVTDGAAGGYDVTAINEFDWQSSGDLVINNVVDAGGTAYTNFPTFVGGFIGSLAGAPVVPASGIAAFASAVSFDIHAHTRLNDMLDNGGGSVAPATLDQNGAPDTGFEITAAIEANETALFLVTVIDLSGNGLVGAGDIFIQQLFFTGITGTFEWYHDESPDSDVESGLGFLDGTPIVTGSITGVGGTATVDASGAFSGSSLLTNTVTGYNSAYIQTDPTANRPLTGTTFDTLISLQSAGEAAANDTGDTIGLDAYIVAAADLGLKADANSEFSANPVPEPQALLLLSIGLLGIGASVKKAHARM